MRYERELKSGSEADAYEKLLEEYDRINRELPEKIPLCPEDIKTGKGLYVYNLLMDMVQDIVAYIIPEGEEKERMVKHMGGEVREYSADRWWARLQEERECTRKMEKRAEEEKQMKEKMEEQIKEQEKQMREQEKKMECLNHLNERLAEDGRLEDILRAAREPAFRQALMREYQCG